MRITRIKTYPVTIPLKPAYHMVSALGRHNVSEYVILRIETDADVDGVGEATVLPRWSGETVWGAKAIIDEVFSPHLLGVDPHDIEEVNRILDAAAFGNWFAKAAVEMACQDIRGKEAGKPLYELLGGATRPKKIRCRFSMGAYDPDRARTRAVELIEIGFTTIKVKVGTGLEGDVARVRVVRDAIGSEYTIVIDANCGYDAETAIEAARRVEQFQVSLFEQPTTRGDFHALARVRANISMPVMADDICFDMADARECIHNAACDVISVYPGKNGGIQRSREIVDYAAEHGIACSIGSNLELDIASAAMCHLVIASQNLQIETWPGDIMGPAYHASSVVKNPLSIDGPTIMVNDTPGLGVEVDWKTVESLRLV